MNSNPPSNPGKGTASDAIAMLGKGKGQKGGGGTAADDGAAFRSAVIEAGGKAAGGAGQFPQNASDKSVDKDAAPTRVQQGPASAPNLTALNRPAVRGDIEQRPAVEAERRQAPVKPETLHQPEDRTHLPQLIDAKAKVEGIDEAKRQEVALPVEPREEAVTKISRPEAPQPEADTQPQQAPVLGLLSTLAPTRDQTRSIMNTDIRQQPRSEIQAAQPARLFAEASDTPKPEQQHNDNPAIGRRDGDTGEQGGARRALDIFGFARSTDTPVHNVGSPPTPKAEAAEPASPTANSVTVIEAKQFPGLSASQSSAAAIVSAVTGEPSWSAMLKGAESISAQSLNQVQNTVNTLRIQLNPVDLGTVDATLKLSAGQLVVELKVETIEAFRHLSDNQQIIVKALKNQGYTVEHINVQPLGTERGLTQQSATPAQSGNPTSGDPSTQSGQQNSQGSGAEERPGRHGRDGQENDNSGSNNKPATDFARSPSDAVYL